MKSRLVSMGWMVVAAGVGLGVMGILGPGEPLERADAAMRQGMAARQLRSRSGQDWHWQEKRTEGGWRWLGWDQQPATEAAMTWVELETNEQQAWLEPGMGPLDLAATLRGLRGQACRELVLGYWPTSWSAAGGMTLKALDEEIWRQPQLVAAAELGRTDLPLAEERRGLAMMGEIPPPPQPLDLESVQSAQIAWPADSAPLLLWAGVSGLGLRGEVADGEVARVPLLVRDGERILPTLPLAVALEALVVQPEELHWQDDGVLAVGQRWKVALDPQGRIAVPRQREATAALVASGGWQELGYDELIGLATADGSAGAATEEVATKETEWVGLSGVGAAAASAGEELGQGRGVNAAGLPEEQPVRGTAVAQPALLERVVWLDLAAKEDGVGGLKGLWRARAAGALLNPGWRVLEFDLAPLRPMTALLVIAVVLLASQQGRHGWPMRLAVAGGTLALPLLLSFAGILAGGWWISPLPALAAWALALMGWELRLFAQRRAARQEQADLARVPIRLVGAPKRSEETGATPTAAEDGATVAGTE